MYIYLITNKVNGFQYVGAAKIFKERVYKHLSDVRRGKGRKGSVQDAIRVHGEENFSFEVVDKANTLNQLALKEQDWIEKLNTMSPNGYNLLRGNYSTRLKNSGKFVRIEVDGQPFKTIKSAAEFYKINESSFRNRLDKGWTPEQAAGITNPPEDYGVQDTFVPITINEISFRCMKDGADHFGVVLCTMRQRLQKGYTAEQAVGLEPPPPKKSFQHPNMKKITIRGKTFDSMRQACLYFSEKTGLKPRTLKARLSKGWSWDDILSPEVSHRQRVKRKPTRTYTIGGKTYRTSKEVGEAFGMNPSTVRLWICKNKDKPLDEIFLNS